MKNINKKLYSVIAVGLLVLCFSLNVLATESSNVDASTSSLPDFVTTSSGDEGTSSNESDFNQGDEGSSDFTDVSSGEGDLSSTESDLLNGSDTESEITDQSDASDNNSDKTSSKTSYQGNIGGYINDEADTSGWGGGTDFVASKLPSPGTTEKKDNLIGVFIKTNNDGFVTEINSDIFIKDFSDWQKIDEGYGDKYAHAQNLYFEKPLIDEQGNYQIKL
jgi:hypothetical protein